MRDFNSASFTPPTFWHGTLDLAWDEEAHPADALDTIERQFYAVLNSLRNLMWRHTKLLGYDG